LVFLTLGEGLGVFDLVVIDLLWWRNTKRIRFSFLPEQSHYQDPTKHISSFLRGIPLFALVAVLSVGIVYLYYKSGKESENEGEVPQSYGYTQAK